MGKNDQTNSRQQEAPSRFRDVKGKPDRQKVASSNKDVKKRKCEGENVPANDALNGPDNQAFRLCSKRLSLFLEVPWKLPSSGLPGLYL